MSTKKNSPYWLRDKGRLNYECTYKQRKLHKIKTQLFPNNNLQERVDNLMPYYAKWGKQFIRLIYDHSKTLEQEFGVLVEKG